MCILQNSLSLYPRSFSHSKTIPLVIITIPPSFSQQLPRFNLPKFQDFYFSQFCLIGTAYSGYSICLNVSMYTWLIPFLLATHYFFLHYYNTFLYYSTFLYYNTFLHHIGFLHYYSFIRCKNDYCTMSHFLFLVKTNFSSSVFVPWIQSHVTTVQKVLHNFGKVGRAYP